MEILIDGHTHLEHGPLSKEYVLEMIEGAKKRNISKLQILDHSHRFKEFEAMYEPLKIIPEQRKWLENEEKKFFSSLDEYLNLIKEVKKLDLPIELSFGLEICYTRQSEEFIRKLLDNYHFDFLVGAIHSVDNILYDMPFSKQLLFEKYPINEIYEHYYDSLIACVNSKLFSQLAHPDTIKLFNYYPTYDLNKTYKKLAAALNENKMLAECNVGCYYRYHHKDLGLSDELLKIFIEENVELITASDAHDPIDVGNYIEQANTRIKELRKELKNV